jgi:hypothetical protein
LGEAAPAVGPEAPGSGAETNDGIDGTGAGWCYSDASMIEEGIPSAWQRKLRVLKTGTFLANGKESATVAPLLKAAGYRTISLGKYLSGYPNGDPTHVPPG